MPPLNKSGTDAASEQPRAQTPVTDPVCGMKVDPATARHSYVHDGVTYYFCSDGCRAKFAVAPAMYLAGATANAPAAGAAHAEVVQDHPGNCPKCGMALEPRTAAVEEAPNPELVDMTRRFWVSTALAVPLLLISMSDMLPGHPLRRALGDGPFVWLQLLLATPVVLWGAQSFFDRAWRSIVNRRLNSFTLISLGVGIAYAYSVVAAIFPGLLP